MRLRSSWGLLVMLAAGAAGAQVDTSAWPVVRMEVLAMDKAGAGLALTPGDVEVTEGGRPVTGRSVVRAVGPQISSTIQTGGILYFPRKRGELEASVDELCKAMGNRVILGYTADSAARDGGERRVNVELDKTRLKQKSVVYAAEGYYAPSQ